MPAAGVVSGALQSCTVVGEQFIAPGGRRAAVLVLQGAAGEARLRAAGALKQAPIRPAGGRRKVVGHTRQVMLLGCGGRRTPGRRATASLRPDLRPDLRMEGREHLVG